MTVSGPALDHIIWTTKGPFGPSYQAGSRAKGHTYERKVNKRLAAETEALGWAGWAHPWGRVIGTRTWFQPDFLAQAPCGALVLFETKLTLVDEARKQLRHYIDLLAPADVLPVLVCRNLTPKAKAWVGDFLDIKPWTVWHLYL